MSSHSKSLMAYAFSHFCVDFTCFYILFHGLRNSTDDLNMVAIGFLLYNVIAFGLQPIIGFVCDDHPRIPIGVIGCGIVMSGLLVLYFPWSWTWLALCLCAFGNACFHIGGGVDSLRFAEGKMTRSGIFVSTGALGVALGTMTGKSGMPAGYLPLFLMTVSILLILLFTHQTKSVTPCLFDISSDRPFAAILLFALAAVVIRSFAGGMVPMAWRTGGFLLLLPGIGACAGKALGGILGDRFGAKTAGVSALVLSIPFILLGKNIVLLSVIGILLFNITMPITLCAVASKFPLNPGLSFGLTTLALLGGNIPTFFFVMPQNFVFPMLIALILLSAIFTFLSTKNRKGETLYGKNHD